MNIYNLSELMPERYPNPDTYLIRIDTYKETNEGEWKKNLLGSRKLKLTLEEGQTIEKCAEIIINEFFNHKFALMRSIRANSGLIFN